MKCLVDTCVWSAVFRHKNPQPGLFKRLEDLIIDGRIAIIGPIRQELLSGISDSKQFDQLKKMLSSFEDVALQTDHFVKAAEFANTCRSKGIQGSTTDFLICAVAYLENLVIFSTDKDFNSYEKCLPIKILPVY
jgi:predicted nucleic acid-binding protein